ncbi:hypothetical protein LNTAR_19307 [Lentisphaera araneosa HTCC2155]|uniref:Uncharacterized protein n=1 Tax=Lentisphaera araneosa HTCC2155 TaxID=313628 RepID=A6DQS7_9BACT|nr:hypothetical protein [Lentisphaera araneosa]EDM25977.1 hypothetical protein LNTAR_19307 [Lentisphaera araneosa HTCC2155]
MKKILILILTFTVQGYSIDLTDLPYFKEGSFTGKATYKFPDNKIETGNGLEIKNHINKKEKILISEGSYKQADNTIKLMTNISLVTNKNGNYEFTLKSNQGLNLTGFIKVISETEYHTVILNGNIKYMITKTSFDTKKQLILSSISYNPDNTEYMKSVTVYQYKKNE